MEPDGIVQLRSGTRITELTSVEARDYGAALIELAAAAERSCYVPFFALGTVKTVRAATTA